MEINIELISLFRFSWLLFSSNTAKKKAPRTCQEYAMQQSDKLKDSSIRTNRQVEKDIRELQNDTSHKLIVSLRFTHARTEDLT